MIARRGIFAAILLIPLLTGFAVFILCGVATSCLASLDDATIPSLCCGLLIALAAHGLFGRLSGTLAAKATGDRRASARLSCMMRRHATQAERALNRAAVDSVGFAAAVGMAAGTRLEPLYASIAFPMALFALGMLLAYAVAACSWQRYFQLMEDSKTAETRR